MAVHPAEKRVDGLERAAGLLGQARLPVIGGLLTDIAGTEAAIALARRLSGVIDHAAGEALSRSTRLMHQVGGCLASFGEVRNRADLVIMLGDAPLERNPDLLQDLFPAEEGLPRPGDNPRELMVLGDRRKGKRRVPTTSIPLGDAKLPTLTAILAALVAGRLRGDAQGVDSKLAKLAERLRGAAFPVFVYSASDLDEPTMHVVHSMADYLCVTTRSAVLSLPALGNGDGVNLCSAWTCGVPVRTRFVKGLPQHDPWLYSTKRLVDSGEADALLWIDALEASTAKSPRGVPTILLNAHQASGTTDAEIVIEVACAGRDHDAEIYLPHISGIGMFKAIKPRTDIPTVAETIDRINALLDSREARQC